MVFKIVTGVMYSMVSYKFIGSHSATRGNRYKLTQTHVHDNFTKFSFSNRVVSIWNRLPDSVVSACSVKILKTVWIIFGETKSVFVNVRPVCPVSEAEFCLMSFEFQSKIIKMRT